MTHHLQTLRLRPRTKKLLRAVPLLALAGGCATLFFGEGVQAAQLGEGGDPHVSEADSPQPMAGTPHWEENYTNAQCTSPGYVAPCDGEEHHWVASRFEPDDYPFVATKVSYTLWGSNHLYANPGCDSTLGHKASVFLGNKSPRSSPTLVQTITVPYDKAAVNDRYVELTLPQGVHISEGQFLYVSIQNSGDASPTVSNTCNGAGKFTCASTCDAPTRGNLSWWSNANTAPFNWASLASFNIHGDVRIGVYGYNP